MKKYQAKYIKNLFNSITNKYDVMNTIMSFGLDKYWRRLAVKHSNLSMDGRGLDVCCGTGMLTIEQARVAGNSGTVTGLDFSEKMLSRARKNIQNFMYNERIDFIRGDVMSLPFNDNEFDCATVGWGLRNVCDIFQAVREMVRVVKPGGKVVSLDMARPEMMAVKYVYSFYLNRIIPFISKLVCNKEKEYVYLSVSIQEFIQPGELAGLFEKAGLEEVRFLYLFCGIVAIVEGRKPGKGF